MMGFIKDVIKLLTGVVSVGGRGGTEEALVRMIISVLSYCNELCYEISVI